MRRTLCALLSLVGIALVSLGVDSACSPIPAENCRGTAVNAKLGTDGELDDHCTECMEANCCDLVGDCQSNDCAGQVTAAHDCVVKAGRRAAVAESDCKKKLGDDPSSQSTQVYACMRASCGEQCSLPTCHLNPLVPPIGSISCDRCFAQSCCPLMNDCAKNRTCLITLSCIVDECRDEIAHELRSSAHDEAVRRRDAACGDPTKTSNPPVLADPSTSCFARCIAQTIGDNSEAAVTARCLAAQIAECGADVDCGPSCESAVDAAVDAPSDGPSE